MNNNLKLTLVIVTMRVPLLRLTHNAPHKKRYHFAWNLPKRKQNFAVHSSRMVATNCTVSADFSHQLRMTVDNFESNITTSTCSFNGWKVTMQPFGDEFAVFLVATNRAAMSFFIEVSSCIIILFEWQIRCRSTLSATTAIVAGWRRKRIICSECTCNRGKWATSTRISCPSMRPARPRSSSTSSAPARRRFSRRSSNCRRCHRRRLCVSSTTNNCWRTALFRYFT